MKILVLTTTLLILTAFNAICQSINNVQADIKGNFVIITYDLMCDSTMKISILYSTDNGTTYNKSIVMATGDIGVNVKLGNTKLIMWNYVADSIADINSITNICVIGQRGASTIMGCYKKQTASGTDPNKKCGDTDRMKETFDRMDELMEIMERY